MATYDYKCSECGTVQTMNKKIDNRDNVSEDVCTECLKVGTLVRSVSAPIIGYSVTTGSYGRVPDGFKEVLKKAHSVPGARQTSSYL